MKRFCSFITSMSFMALLLLLLAIAMAAATFIESSYGTPAARSLVYNSHWFELLWILFGLNLLNNIVKYKLLSVKRFSIGLFHIAFLVMLLGAGVTRWFSNQGTMHIREGQSTDYFLTSRPCFYAGIHGQGKKKSVLFSEITPRQYSAKFIEDNAKVKVKTVGFISNAERKAIPSNTGSPIIDIVFSSQLQKGMQSYSLKKGEVLDHPAFKVGFDSVDDMTINFFHNNEHLFMISDNTVQEATMGSRSTVTYSPGDTIEVKKMFLYSCDNVKFLVRNFFQKAKFTAVKSHHNTEEQAVIVKVSYNNQQQIIPVFGNNNLITDTVNIQLDDIILKMYYGPEIVKLPFNLFLKKFDLDYYPGSQSPSSYSSRVVVKDENMNYEKEATISMNKTMMYKGYKFFQTSYDHDEKGTILSVNFDFMGTWISYLSYLLLIIGFIWSLINKHSYFRKLVNHLKSISVKTGITVFLIFVFSQDVLGQTGIGASIPSISKNVTIEFGNLWVQGNDGRIEPLNTLNSEIVRKISRKSRLYGKSADEVILSMMTYPEIWKTLPILRVSNKMLSAQLGVNGKYVSIHQLFDLEGNYRIAGEVRAAFSKPPALRSRLEKEYIYLDEKVSICFMVFNAKLLHLFPGESIQKKWYSPGDEAIEYSEGDSMFIRSGIGLLKAAVVRGNQVEAMQVIEAIDGFQKKYGESLLPSLKKKNVEILYNKVNPFERIFPYYLLLGFIFLLILFVNIFRLNVLNKYVKGTLNGLILILFFIHTTGLIVRWYISGRAPWSNGYESIVYVGWTAMLAGLIFGRRYPMVVATASILSGIALFVGHLSWMSPEITPLVPVLKSYWLTIHVSVITASYGFIGLSALLGILVLVFIIIRNNFNEKRVNLYIDQLTTINELSATIGIYFLTMGTFFGAVWANESWGRYWGWDPKETWALITIIVYTFIVHMRLIPSLKGILLYNIASVVGFSSVLMTYFGVNYYLSGLHSYGKVDADGINPIIPIVFLLLLGLMIWAYLKDEKYESKKTKN